MLSIALVAYLMLFILVGVLFLFVSLLIGWFIRPRAPSVTKGESYECGEPSVGSAFIQFDLRFYVVALLFIIFEVELAFFFPPAVVFGKVNQLRGPSFAPILQKDANVTGSTPSLSVAAKQKFGELGIPASSAASNASEETIQADLRSLAMMALLDIGVFFVVLLVGFAYLWRQGDLNWVRAISRPAGEGSIRLAALPRTGAGS